MKETVHFTKMQGAGNDYIYVDTEQYNIPDPEKAAIAWSAYHTGIGSDGLVLIGKPHDGRRADYSMRIFNADGSEAMMCGNASRCIGKYLYEKGLTRKDTIRLETLSGVKILRLHIQETNNHECRVYTYESCRGLEAWATVCLRFGELFTEEHPHDYKVIEYSMARDYMLTLWTLIPLTRAVDRLVLIVKPEGKIHRLLKELAKENPDFITYE